MNKSHFQIRPNWIKNFVGLFTVFAVLFLSLVTIPQTFADIASIDAEDHFTLTVAGNATSMDSGGTLVFTVKAYDDLAQTTGQDFTGANYAYIHIIDPSTWQHHASADITAVNNMTVVGHKNAVYGNEALTADNSIAGTNDNIIKVNIPDGDGLTNTFTVTATSSFGVFIEAPGITINDDQDSDTPPGQDFREITVAQASSGADRLVATFGAVGASEVGTLYPVTITQVNSGGGVVTSALSDVALDTSPSLVAAGSLSNLITTSADHDLGPYGIVKFTSAGNTNAYYMTSAPSNSTFYAMGGVPNVFYSDSNIIPVTGLAVSATTATLDGGDTVTKNVASVVNTDGETTFVPGDIVSLAGSGAGECGTRGYFSVISTVNNGADSTVTVMGPVNGFASCLTAAGNITKLTLTDDSSPNLSYTISNSTFTSGYFTSVGGVPIVGETTTAVTGKSLTSGTLSAIAVPSGTGTFVVAPFSTTLGITLVGSASDTIGAESAVAMQGYGPNNGQSGVPTMAPVDMMFNKDPSLSTSFPLTNTTSTTFSLVSGATPGAGTAVPGTWNYFSDTWGGSTMYRVSFQPTSPLADNTEYTASVKQTFAASTNFPEGFMAALDDDGTYLSFTFTTGTGGGDFMEGGGFGGDMGGAFPPIAMLGYPMPGSWDVPTNLGCVTVDFDRAMDASTLTTSNIYLKKIVNSAEVAVSGSPVVTVIGDNNDSVCISGYTLEASSEYRVVVTRDVKDTSGAQLAGMPVDDGGNTTSGFGFGFANMGPFKETFHTGAGSSTVTASLIGLSLGTYGSTITNVPVGSIIRASFNNSLNPSTVNSTNVTLKQNGSVPVAGQVKYDTQSNSIEFVPTSALVASTSYTFKISTGVQSISATALNAAITQTFTTGAADSTDPKVVFADADNYGFRVQFDETLKESTATDRSYYTLKTCNGGSFSDASTCAGGTISSKSLSSGVQAHYDKMDNSVWMDGLTLTPGDSYWVEVSSSVTDLSNNGVDVLNKSWTGKIMDGQNFAGGQGMFNMGTMGFEDFNMADMGERPIEVRPMNTMAGATTKYFVNMPLTKQIPADGYVELTFPSGFVVSGAKRDAQSPMNSDFNGPATGTVTFDNNITSISSATDGGGAQANDGVGYISAARKVYIQLSAATQVTDFLKIDLDGITNPNEARGFESSGYQVQIKTYNSSGVLLEAMTTMPIFISSAGSYSITGTVYSGVTGLNDVKVFLNSPMTGPMETTTATTDSVDGAYAFSNLSGGDYMIWTEPSFTSGVTDYKGQEWPEPIHVDGVENKSFSVSALSAGGSTATLPISISWTGSLPTNLGFNDSIDIFAGGPNGFIVKTISRSTLTAGGSPYTTSLYLPSVGEWFVGIGPALPKGPMSTMPKINWMPSKNISLIVDATALSDGFSTQSFIITASDKTITGKVVDGSGTAISNVEVYAYNPKQGMDSHTVSLSDGTFSLDVVTGNYKVGAFIPGMPGSQEVSVDVQAAANYVNGSPTATTGSSGANPFYLKIAKPGSTIQGRVSDGTNAISNASVWAHRTDAPGPPVNAITNSSGNYTLYVTSGTWMVEADAPGYGYVGSKTVTVSTNSEAISGKNFTVTASDLGTITGTVGSQSGVMVWAYGSAGGNSAKTDATGVYTMKVPAGTYTLEAFVPSVGELNSLANVVVVGGETNSGNNFTLGNQRTIVIDIKDSEGSAMTLPEDSFIDFFNSTGKGNGMKINSGSSSGVLKLVDGDYNMGAHFPGIPYESLSITGATYSSLTGQITVDDPSESIIITLPALFTVTGQITDSLGAGVNDVWVSFFNKSTKKHFGVQTSSNAAGGGLDGEYSIKVPVGTFSVSAEKPGYSSLPIDLAVSAASADNDFVLTANSRTITGTVKDSQGNAIANAFVWATGNGGGFAGTESGTDGTYTLSVKSSIWTVNAGGMGYGDGTAVTVDTTSASKSGKNFTLTALTGANALKAPKTGSVVPSAGGTINDTETNTKLVIPPNALGSGSDAGQITTSETNKVARTPNATPIGNGQSFSATDANGNPITTFDDDVEFTLELTAAELATEGVDTGNESEQVTNAYWDESTNAWITVPTSIVYYDSSNNVLAKATVTAAASLTAAGVDHVDFVSETDHFTTYAPIVPSGATPPATPATPVASGTTTSQVTLTWTANSEDDMSSYNIWEANVTEGVATTYSHASCSTTCSKTVTGLSSSTAYSFQIIAVDTDGNQSAGSTAVSVTTSAPTVVSSSSSPAYGGGAGTASSSSNASVATSTTSSTDDTTTSEEATSVEEPTLINEETSSSTVAEFVDTVGNWANSYIVKLKDAGIISGVDNTHFAPDREITRAELTKIAVKTFGVTIPESVSEDPFKDVDSGEWFAPYVKAAFDDGMVGGYNDGTFKPNASITRAEAMKILLEAGFGNIQTPFNAGFSDVIAGSWYARYINYANEHGIIDGYGNGKFGPDDKLTRAQASKIVVKVMDLVEADSGNSASIPKMQNFVSAIKQRFRR